MSKNRRPRIAVVMAAGKGTRMRSERPKVLHSVAGRPMLEWVLDAAQRGGCEKVLVIVGHGADEVRAAFPHPDIVWVEQREQLGTGHAVAQAEPHVPEDATMLVLSGDVPLVTPETLEQLAAAAESAGQWGAMAVAELEQPGALGRVIASPEGSLKEIIEYADADDAVRAVRLINAGIYALPAGPTFDYLRKSDDQNAQGEIYLTDAVSAAAKDDESVRLVVLDEPDEALGINDRVDLAQAHRALIERHMRQLMATGVTILEPARTVIEGNVRVGVETVIHPGVSLLGHTEVGSGCTLHQGVWMRDSKLEEGVEVHPYSILEEARVASRCAVGPFARLRPASVLLEGARVGNFVETKNAQLGANTKASHLTYLGDASIGDDTNIGAGVVTCNYDGSAKHRTEIGDQAFVGSDTMLIAPITVGDRATTAAGSTVTEDVPDDALAVGRSKQRNIPGWSRRRPRKRAKKTE